MLRSMPTRLIVEGGESGGIASWRTEHTVSYEEAFKRELLEFHAAVTEGRAPRTDGVDGLRDVAWSQAIVRAHLGDSPIEHPTALRRDAPSVA
jgi:predicted dehydrogenase